MLHSNSLLYKIISAVGVKIIAGVEWLVRRNSINNDVFDLHDFLWVASVEADYEKILAELNALLHGGKNIHDFSKLSPEQQRIVQPEKWKSYIFSAYGNFVQQNCERCPDTFNAISKIPNIRSAMFSVFEPGTHLQPHRGPYCGLLRYHLALIVPHDNSQCGIKINGKTYHWQQGRSLIFDDTFEHEAWNHSTEKRVVLFIDFERPLPFWLKPLNRFMIWLIGSSPFVKNILANINRLEQ
jgi:beta-hydroxylase